MPVTYFTVTFLIWNNHGQPCPTLRSSAPSLLVLEQPPGTGWDGEHEHTAVPLQTCLSWKTELQAPPVKLKPKKKSMISLLPHPQDIIKAVLTHTEEWMWQGKQTSKASPFQHTSALLCLTSFQTEKPPTVGKAVFCQKALNKAKGTPWKGL